MCVLLSLLTKINFVFNITYNLYFSINLILRTTRNARIPTVQRTVPVPMRPLTSDCTVLMRYGQYPSIARTIYGAQPYRISLFCPSRPSIAVDGGAMRSEDNFDI